jgi:UDP-N-acetylmuramate dehydrogenase
MPADVTRAQVPLAAYTTLGIGGPAATFLEPPDEPGLTAAVRSADERGEPVLVLGGGSNVVVADDGFPGTVIRVAIRGITIAHADAPAPGPSAGAGPAPAGAGPAPAGAGPAPAGAGPAPDGSGPAPDGSGPAPDGSGPALDGAVTMTVAAGEDWDAVVARCVAEGLAGVECLSGIPGLAGATPIQNVGAYGQEVADTITAVRAYDRQRRAVAEIPAAECGFAYRTSAFKGAPFRGGAAAGRFVVLAVTFRLARGPLSAPIRYPELATTLGVAPGERVPLGEARSAVLKLRARKGMVLDAGDPDSRSAGSFFTNPILTSGEFAVVEERARRACGPETRVPHFPAGDGQVKVPAAWLIERAGFGKGYRLADGPPGGAARISSKHTLALVNPGDATAAGLLALAREIRDGVRASFGVSLVIEPVLVGLTI